MNVAGNKIKIFCQCQKTFIYILKFFINPNLKKNLLQVHVYSQLIINYKNVVLYEPHNKIIFKLKLFTNLK